MAEILIPGDNCTVEVSSDGSTWEEVAGASGISTSGGEAPETDIVTFKGVAKITGRPRVPTATVTLASYLAHLPIMETLRLARNNKTALSWRFRTIEETIFSIMGATQTISIVEEGAANPGRVSFAAGDDGPDFTDLDLYGVGMTIEVGGTSYIITDITAAGVVTVVPPAAAVTNQDDYKVNVPSLQLGPFVATIREFGNFELATENALASSIGLGLRSQLPQWRVV